MFNYLIVKAKAGGSSLIPAVLSYCTEDQENNNPENKPNLRVTITLDDVRGDHICKTCLTPVSSMEVNIQIPIRDANTITLCPVCVTNLGLAVHYTNEEYMSGHEQLREERRINDALQHSKQGIS